MKEHSQRPSLRRLAALVLPLWIGCNAFEEVSAPLADASAEQRLDLAVDVDQSAVDLEPDRPVGPGPQGALPTGYCCDQDEECRYRTCQAFGADKMCVDSCTFDENCADILSGFTCGASTGKCIPPQPLHPCEPASSFQHGTKTLGQCCTKEDECLSGLCIRASGKPFICVRHCLNPWDCDSGYNCHKTSDGFSVCWPAIDAYTCMP